MHQVNQRFLFLIKLLQSGGLEELYLISNSLKDKINLLADSIRLSKSLVILEIFRNFIGDSHIGQFLAENNSITSLSLINNNISLEGYKFLKKMKRLKKLTLKEVFYNFEESLLFSEIFEGMSLEFIYINGFIISDDISKNLLIKLIENLKLKELILKNTFLYSICQVISKIISENTLKTLYIFWNDFDTKEMKILIEKINQCNSIEKLSFKKNLNDKTLSVFNLEKNNSIKELTIFDFNKIEGMKNICYSLN